MVNTAIKRCLLVLGLWLVSPASWAIDYLVEVVIFENRQPSGSVLPGNVYVPKTSDAMALGDATAIAAGFRVLDEEELTLADSARKIDASRRYRVLGHFGWQQPGLDAENALAIRIGLGELSTLYIDDESPDAEVFLPASMQPGPARTRNVRIPAIYGTIKVRLGRFLHMESELVYTDGDNGRGYRLLQSRKMRSRELHYIDNERFGILTRILPVPESEEEDLTDEAVDEDDTPQVGDADAPLAVPPDQNSQGDSGTQGETLAQ